ncbi:unnamed protein product [Paramecium pentaurelia]|uniref:Uncharacterized protein n=1 Tax=Paramecium pentaurelia TaxID=43138 RepID=A0A8S1XAI2_9CILI|nr:unnamed protein product [Paramecium pentaurelia]
MDQKLPNQQMESKLKVDNCKNDFEIQVDSYLFFKSFNQNDINSLQKFRNPLSHLSLTIDLEIPYQKGFKQDLNFEVQTQNVESIKVQKTEQKDFDNEQKEETQVITGWLWDSVECRFIPSIYQIKLTLDNKIVYTKDGETLRIDEIKDASVKPEVLANLEQICHLKWYGKYSQKGQKIGRWSIKWKGEDLKEVNGYYTENGKKQGKWKDLINNFWTQAEAYEIGEYVNGKRKGYWKEIYNDKEIGGGVYDEQGEKNGKWIELSEDFWDQSQVTFQGEFKNGKKVGRWQIWYENIDIWGNKNENIVIGGGSYDNKCEGLKIGLWIDLAKRFYFHKQVTYKGQYKNGKNVGRWDIWFRLYDEKEFKQIGGGQYDDNGDGIKIGKWVELDDEFFSLKQVTYNGVYDNGNKVGRWNVEYRQCGSELFSQIGGGQYNSQGYGIKTGEWIELDKEFYEQKQIIYIGKYKNGKKVGRWDVEYRQCGSDLFSQIGGGQYDEDGDGIKIGKWIELDNGFYYNKQVTYNGVYNNGKKVGRWDIEYRQCGSDLFSQIGGGQYDDQGNIMKTGKWIELDKEFYEQKQIIYIGEYKNSKKVGRWDIQFRQFCSDQFSIMYNYLKIVLNYFFVQMYQWRWII